MPQLAALRVVRSGIHGYGLVATRPFARGDVITDVDGHLWHQSQPLDDRYSLWLGDGWFFDMLDQTRWINHSCAPNAEVEGAVNAPDKDDAHGWARLVAVRDIAVGDEITYDYGFTADLAEPCACGGADLPRPHRRRRPSCRTPARALLDGQTARKRRGSRVSTPAIGRAG